MSIDVAVIGSASSAVIGGDRTRNEVEILMPVVHEALEQTGLSRADVGFVCSGSNDYLTGAPFSFVISLDAYGAWPPIQESHVEMDGAWALYEAWVKLQLGALDTALVYAYGKSSNPDDLGALLTQWLDPYVLAPLGPDPVALGGLGARAYVESHPGADAALLTVEPPPVTDGAAVVVLAAGDRAAELCERPAWITGIDHRLDPHSPGLRDLARSPSTERAAQRAGVADGPVDVAELHAQFPYEEAVLREALGLGDEVVVNPSGGPRAANPFMATGLVRIGEAARAIHDGRARRVVAHATQGPCLQQNLVCVMEAR